MRKISCPRCGSDAARVVLMEGYKPYCCRCGWNSEIALSELSLTLKADLFVVAVGLIFAILICLKNASEIRAASGVFLAFAILPGSYAVAVYLQRRRLKSL